MAGAVLLIIKNDKIIKHTAYGYKLRYNSDGSIATNSEPMTTDTLFDIASNTKMYATNYAIMHLVYLGKINLNEPIKSYFPEYTGCDSNGNYRDTRLVRDLLTHTAGYEPDPHFFNENSIKPTSLYSQNPSLTKKIILTQLPFIRQRDGKPCYSDIDYMLLGMLIEKITQMPLNQYVENTIYKPLNLQHTMFTPLAHGYLATMCAATELQGNTRGDTISFANIRTKTIRCEVHDEKAYYSMGGISGHAGLFSNASDLAVLLQIMLNNGRYKNVVLWNKKIEDEFTTAHHYDDTYGLGWRRSGANHYYPFGNYASESTVGHTGWTGTLTLIDRINDLAIVLLTNKLHSKYANGAFATDLLETNNYNKIVNLVYEALGITKRP